MHGRPRGMMADRTMTRWPAVQSIRSGHVSLADAPHACGATRDAQPAPRKCRCQRMRLTARMPTPKANSNANANANAIQFDHAKPGKNESPRLDAIRPACKTCLLAVLQSIHPLDYQSSHVYFTTLPATDSHPSRHRFHVLHPSFNGGKTGHCGKSLG